MLVAAVALGRRMSALLLREAYEKLQTLAPMAGADAQRCASPCAVLFWCRVYEPEGIGYIRNRRQGSMLHASASPVLLDTVRVEELLEGAGSV